MLNKICRDISHARLKNTIIRQPIDEALKNLTIKQGYSLQKNIIAKMNTGVVGWKLGATNIHGRQALNIEHLIWGPVFDGGILSDPAQISLSHGEVEVAFKLNSNIEYCNETVLPMHLNNYIECVALAVEYPWSVFELSKKINLNTLIADCCASGQCLIGKAIPFAHYSGDSQVRIIIDNKELETGSTKNIIGGISQSLCDFINEARNEGFLLQGNQWIFTGSLTSLMALNHNSKTIIACDQLPSIQL